MVWDLDKNRNNIAIIDETGVFLSYCQLGTEGGKIAETVGRRCLIFCLCENSIGSVFGYVGFINNRIVPVLLNRHLEREMLDHLLEIYCPAYLWMPEY